MPLLHCIRSCDYNSHYTTSDHATNKVITLHLIMPLQKSLFHTWSCHYYTASDLVTTIVIILHPIMRLKKSLLYTRSCHYKSYYTASDLVTTIVNESLHYIQSCDYITSDHATRIVFTLHPNDPIMQLQSLLHYILSCAYNSHSIAVEIIAFDSII